MSFKVNFTKKSSNRLAGIITVSCTITCTNWMFGDTVDIALYDCYGQNPWYYRDLKFKSGQSYTFDYDTVGWQWCQGDYIAIVDKNNKILQKWHLQIPEYRPGECPECHGTHKCRACNGEGYVYPRGKVWQFKRCERCGGTGICQTCDIPRRKQQFGGGPTGLKPF